MKRNEFFKICGAGICGCGGLGRPVSIVIEESVLRGGSRCSFRVAIKG